MPYITTNDGCKIYYQTMGSASDKPVIVFLNGTLQNHLNWKSLAQHLTDKHGILMYDARTQGQSATGSRKLSLELHVSDLMQLLDHLRLENINLVGLSHGARVALSFAIQKPEHLNRLVLCSIGSAMTRQARFIIESWQRVLIAGGLEAMIWATLPWVFGKAYITRNQNIMGKMVSALVRRNRKEGLMSHLKAVLSYKPLDQQNMDIGCPTLVISGSEDPITGPDQGEKLAKLCHGRHKTFTDVGHTIPAEAPERFKQQLIKFL